jgi:hypothetical protein
LDYVLPGCVWRADQFNCPEATSISRAPLARQRPFFARVDVISFLVEKLKAIDHLRPAMSKRAVLFGATILGRGIEPNAPERSLLRLYNGKGVFNNLDDDLAGLIGGLKARFGEVAIETRGCVALFRGR